MRRSQICIVWIFLMLTGCAQRVQVFDIAGKPVEGADVSADSLSISMHYKTDAKGDTWVATNNSFQDVKWVSIGKDGFQGVQIPVPAKWPLRVTLQPVTPKPGA